MTFLFLGSPWIPCPAWMMQQSGATWTSGSDESVVDPVVRPTRGPRPYKGLPSYMSQLVLLALFYFGYTGSRTLASGDLGPAEHHAAGLLAREQWLHIDIELWLNHRVSGALPVSIVASYWYAVLHYVVTPAVLVWLYGRDHRQYARTRNALIAATVIGLAVYLLFPTAPPRLMPGPYIDTLAQVSQYGWWSTHASAPTGLGGLTNELAAMPSLHVGWAVWVAWIVWRNGKSAHRIAGVAYPIATSVVVVGTGNHWVVDAVAGAGTAAVGILVTSPARLLARTHSVVSTPTIRNTGTASTPSLRKRLRRPETVVPQALEHGEDPAIIAKVIGLTSTWSTSHNTSHSDRTFTSDGRHPRAEWSCPRRTDVILKGSARSAAADRPGQGIRDGV
jgi:hypothetical protein